MPRQASYEIIRADKKATVAGPGRGDCAISANNNTAIQIYDTPLWKAVAFIADKIGEAKDTAYFPKTRALIEEKAIAGDLCLWGRKQLDVDPKWVDTRKFANRHTPIPCEYWPISKLAPYCVVEPVMEDRDHNRHIVLDVPCTQEADKGTWPNERNSYADLQLNWKQVVECWGTPEPIVGISTEASSDDKFKRSRHRKKQKLTQREENIVAVLRANIQGKLRGVVYCHALELRKIPPPPGWTTLGCPMTYPEAYKLKKWRHRIQDEKYRLSQFLPKKRTRRSPPTS